MAAKRAQLKFLLMEGDSPQSPFPDVASTCRVFHDASINELHRAESSFAPRMNRISLNLLGLDHLFILPLMTKPFLSASKSFASSKMASAASQALPSAIGHGHTRETPTNITSTGTTPLQSNQPTSTRERVSNDGTLAVFSKRNERQRKKQALKKPHSLSSSSYTGDPFLLSLPYDILIQILAYLRPSSVFRLARTCRALHSFLLHQHPSRIAHAIISWRYPILAQCMRLPVLLSAVDGNNDDTTATTTITTTNQDNSAPSKTPTLSFRDVLLDEERVRGHDIRRRPYYQHLMPPDPHLVCTCLTCTLRWHVLCLAVDFAHWQDRLDAGEPLPAIPRGERPAWNARLLEAHAGVVLKAVLDPTILSTNTTNSGPFNPPPPPSSSPASSSFSTIKVEACDTHIHTHPTLSSPLWHAAILQAHLTSTIRSIQRQQANKFNHRPRFRLTPQDAASGTDSFLGFEGPPSMDMPFHRDNYYMLEAYLPNRSWFADEKRWGYMPPEQHQSDLEQLRKFVLWRREMMRGKSGSATTATTRSIPNNHNGGSSSSSSSDDSADTAATATTAGSDAKSEQTKRINQKEETWVMKFNGSSWRPVLVLRDSGGESSRRSSNRSGL